METDFESIVPECYIGLFQSLDISDILPPQPPTKLTITTTTTTTLTNLNNNNTKPTNNSVNQQPPPPPKFDNLNDHTYAYYVGPILALFIITWNLLLIWSLVTSNRKQRNINMSITKKLFIYHSCTDLIAGVLVIPIQIAMHVGLGYTCFYLSVAVTLTSFSQCTGVSTLLTISFLRYLSIMKPLLILQNSYIVSWLLVQTLVSFSISAYTFVTYYTRSTAHNIALNYSILAVFLTINAIALVTCNMKSFFVLKAQRQRITSSNTRTNDNRLKAVYTLVWITWVFVLTIAPYVVYVCFLSIYLYSPGARLLGYFKHLQLFVPINVIYLLNCGLSAMIYNLRNRKRQYRQRKNRKNNWKAFIMNDRATVSSSTTTTTSSKF